MKIWNEIWDYVKMIIIVVVVVLVINNVVLINAKIPSESMENTIMTGDRVIGSRLSYRFEDPKRGDIAIHLDFTFPIGCNSLYCSEKIIQSFTAVGA